MINLKDLVDKYVFISLPDLVSLNNLNLMVKNIVCDEFSYECDILINKFNTRPAVSAAGLNSILKYPVNAFIPYDRDIEFLANSRGPDSIFDYNLRITRNLKGLSQRIFEELGQ